MIQLFIIFSLLKRKHLIIVSFLRKVKYLLVFIVLCPSILEARIYIDVTSPALSKLPIAIQKFTGHPEGKELSEIVKEDLKYTGLFSFIDEDAYLESSLESFNPDNWRPLGIEIVVKGTIEMGKTLNATISIYDVIELREILKKRYSVKKHLLRSLSHQISNEVYKNITGHKGIFSTKIAFVAKGKDGSALYRMDWDGHRTKRIIKVKKGALIMSPHWSFDSKRIVYSSERNRKWGIYMIDFEDIKEYLLYSSEGTNIAGDFTPDDKYFTISSSRRGDPDIYLFDIKKKKIKRLTYTNGIEISSSVSPDGKEIVFVSDRGGTPQLYIMNMKGYNIRRITFKGTYNTSPDWSSSGKRIAFSGRVNGKNQIFIINPDRSGLKQLTDVGNNEEPSFSSDGRFISFTSDREGIKKIFIMRSNGGGQKRISPKDLKAFAPAWSPN